MGNTILKNYTKIICLFTALFVFLYTAAHAAQPAKDGQNGQTMPVYNTSGGSSSAVDQKKFIQFFGDQQTKMEVAKEWFGISYWDENTMRGSFELIVDDRQVGVVYEVDFSNNTIYMSFNYEGKEAEVTLELDKLIYEMINPNDPMDAKGATNYYRSAKQTDEYMLFFGFDSFDIASLFTPEAPLQAGQTEDDSLNTYFVSPEQASRIARFFSSIFSYDQEEKDPKKMSKSMTDLALILFDTMKGYMYETADADYETDFNYYDIAVEAGISNLDPDAIASNPDDLLDFISFITDIETLKELSGLFANLEELNALNAEFLKTIYSLYANFKDLFMQGAGLKAAESEFDASKIDELKNLIMEVELFIKAVNEGRIELTAEEREKINKYTTEIRAGVASAIAKYIEAFKDFNALTMQLKMKEISEKADEQATVVDSRKYTKVFISLRKKRKQGIK